MELFHYEHQEVVSSILANLSSLLGQEQPPPQEKKQIDLEQL